MKIGCLKSVFTYHIPEIYHFLHTVRPESVHFPEYDTHQKWSVRVFTTKRWQNSSILANFSPSLEVPFCMPYPGKCPLSGICCSFVTIKFQLNFNLLFADQTLKSAPFPGNSPRTILTHFPRIIPILESESNFANISSKLQPNSKIFSVVKLGTRGY